MKGRVLINKIKAGLDDWKMYGSYNTHEADDPRRTFVTNIDRKNCKHLLSYIKHCEELGLDYEVRSDAFDTNGNKHFFMIAFYIKGPHKDMQRKLIDLVIADAPHIKW